MSLQTMYDEIERLENENSKLKEKIQIKNESITQLEYESVIQKEYILKLKEIIKDSYQMLTSVGYLQGAFKTKYTIEYLKGKKDIWIKN